MILYHSSNFSPVALIEQNPSSEKPTLKLEGLPQNLKDYNSKCETISDIDKKISRLKDSQVTLKYSALKSLIYPHKFGDRVTIKCYFSNGTLAEEFKGVLDYSPKSFDLCIRRLLSSGEASSILTCICYPYMEVCDYEE